MRAASSETCRKRPVTRTVEGLLNETARKQAARAALVHRFQLDALHLALRSLEDHLDALESESDRQRDALSHLERKIARLRDEAGLPHPSNPVRLDSQQRIEQHAPEHHRPFPSGTRAAPQSSPHPPAILPPPDLGEDWDAYIHNVERYIADHGIEVTPDPVARLLPRIAPPRSDAGSTPTSAPRRGIAGTTASSLSR